jgi:alpha-N-acetylglucosamine transferase
MVTPEVSAAVRDLLHDLGGFQIVNVAAIGNPAHNNPRYANVYTKLNAWKLVNYEHVLLLDADTIVVGKLDELLSMRIGTRNIAAGDAVTTRLCCV